MGRSKASFTNAVPLHDLTQGFGPDIYENLDKHKISPMVKELILKARNNPSKIIKMHILMPTGSRGVNPGDEGLLDRESAIQQGRATMPDGFRITAKNVSARDLFSTGDLSKWTWKPGKAD
jgi:hypothetical protein